MAFADMLTEVVDIVRQSAAADGSGAPVADWTEVVYASVPAQVEDRYPKLHGDQNEAWNQLVITQSHQVIVLGLYEELGEGNGYGVKFGATLWRVANIWRFRSKGREAPDHAGFICEELGS